jgi:hypothetical protein
LQTERQTRAKLTESFVQREQFQGEHFAKVLGETVLNPEWMTWAASSRENYATAQMQVRLLLERGHVEATSKFGKVEAPPTNAGGPDALDEYEAQGAVDGYLTELLARPEYNGVLTSADRPAILQQLVKNGVTTFVPDQNGQWHMNERPVNIAVQMVVSAKSASQPRPSVPVAAPAAPVARRNAAAVPTPAIPPAPVVAKPKPAGKPDFSEQPWLNPDLSFQEKQRLYRKHKFGGE